jgi:hypothetical protein
MSAGAWIFMAVSWLFVIVLNLFCFGRLLRENNRKK